MNVSGETPLQRAERERSNLLMVDVGIREELDLATDEELRVLVFSPVDRIARAMGISPAVARRLRRAGRQRVISKWNEEDARV